MARGKAAILVKLLSSAGTGYFYVKVRGRCRCSAGMALFWRCFWGCKSVNPNAYPLLWPLLPRRPQKKNPKKLVSKLEFIKYDPRVMRHVLFTETKLK